MSLSFGLIGMGRFGQLWSKCLSPFGHVIPYDNKIKKYHHQKNFQQALNADIVFLLVPISILKQSCKEIKPFLNPRSLVVDCCSVKIYPAKTMQSILPKTQSILATHPLFGPDSIKRSKGSLQGHKIVLCPLRHCEKNNQYQQLIKIFKKMGLETAFTTPQKHDEQMARSQGLVHFIGRGLSPLQLKSQQLATPDYQALRRIDQMVCNDTWQLFWDMHRYNPLTNKVRNQFVQNLIELNHNITQIKNMSSSKVSQLEKLRKKINKADQDIISALRKRLVLVQKIGEIKKLNHIKVKDNKREEALKQFHFNLSVENQLDPNWIQALFKQIIQYSRRLQK